MSFTVIVNLWRIFKAVETLGGYDSVSNSSSFDCEKKLCMYLFVKCTAGQAL